MLIETQNREQEILYLDQELLKSLNYLKDKWFVKDIGFVACTLIDGDRSVTATNIFESSNKIKHAELNAVNLYEKSYGMLTPQALVAVTLSPCVVYSGYRVGPACTQLLLEKGITRVHVGLMHEKQGGLETYSKMGFDLTFSINDRIKRVSKLLLDLYVSNKNLIADNLDYWLQIKRNVGLDIFR